MNEVLKFSIKYSFFDYLHISNYSFDHVLEVLKEKNNILHYWLFKLFKPLILVIISTIHKFGKLKHPYHFELGESFSRSSQGHSSKLQWNRFKSYAESSKAIFLQLDKNMGNDGQVVILKRILNKNDRLKLFAILSENNIEKAKLDLNMDI